MFLGPKIIECPAGKWTTVKKSMCTHMPNSWQIEFLDVEEIKGEYHRETGLMFWPIGAGQKGALKRKMTIERGWSDDYFCFRVRPETTVKVKIY